MFLRHLSPVKLNREALDALCVRYRRVQYDNVPISLIYNITSNKKNGPKSRTHSDIAQLYKGSARISEIKLKIREGRQFEDVKKKS